MLTAVGAPVSCVFNPRHVYTDSKGSQAATVKCGWVVKLEGGCVHTVGVIKADALSQPCYGSSLRVVF